MTDIASFNGKAIADIASINGKAIADIASINGHQISVGVEIPQNGIIPLRGGGGIPSGWTYFSSANAKYIIGAGSSYAAGASSSGSGSLTVTSSSNGGHTVQSNNFRHDSSGAAGTTSHPAHPHTISTVSHPDFYRQYMRLIKANAAIDVFPTAGIIFLHTTAAPSGMTRDDPGRNRLFQANSSDTQAGNDITGHTMDNRWGSHCHGCIRGDDGSGSGGSQWKSGYPADHTHTMNVTWTNNLHRRALSMWYQASGTRALDAISPGNPIIMYSGSVAPDGWVLCNGGSGSPDMRNRFINCVGVGDATPGQANGNGTVQGVGTATSTGDHDHDNGDKCGGCDDASGYHAANGGTHAHTGTRSAVTWLPPYYALTFIMFTG